MAKRKAEAMAAPYPQFTGWQTRCKPGSASRSFSATSRSSRVSQARNTWPNAPRPTRSKIPRAPTSITAASAYRSTTSAVAFAAVAGVASVTANGYVVARTRASVSAKVARDTGVAMLLFGPSASGFVDAGSGKLALDASQTQMGRSGYRLQAALVEPYKANP